MVKIQVVDFQFLDNQHANPAMPCGNVPLLLVPESVVYLVSQFSASLQNSSCNCDVTLISQLLTALPPTFSECNPVQCNLVARPRITITLMHAIYATINCMPHSPYRHGQVSIVNPAQVNTGD